MVHSSASSCVPALLTSTSIRLWRARIWSTACFQDSGRVTSSASTEAAVGVVPGQQICALPPGVDAEPKKVGGRFLEEDLRDGDAQPAVGAGDEDDALLHAVIVTSRSARIAPRSPFDSDPPR